LHSPPWITSRFRPWLPGSQGDDNQQCQTGDNVLDSSRCTQSDKTEENNIDDKLTNDKWPAAAYRIS